MIFKNFIRNFFTSTKKMSTADIALYLMPAAMRLRNSPASAAQFAVDTAEALQLELYSRFTDAAAKPAVIVESSNS